MIRAFLRIVANRWVCSTKTINNSDNSRKLIPMKVTIRILARPVFLSFYSLQDIQRCLILSLQVDQHAQQADTRFRNAPPEHNNVFKPHSLISGLTLLRIR